MHDATIKEKTIISFISLFFRDW